MNAAQKLLISLSDHAETQVRHTYPKHQRWLPTACWCALGLYLVTSIVAGFLSGWATLSTWLG